MDSIQELLSSGKPILIASSSDGMLRVQIGNTVYEYWIDAALHPWLKKWFYKDSWRALNFVKKETNAPCTKMTVFTGII
jgi:hypothetical protein